MVLYCNCKGNVHINNHFLDITNSHCFSNESNSSTKMHNLASTYMLIQAFFVGYMQVVIGLVGSVLFMATKIRANLKDFLNCFQVVCGSVARKISLDSSNSLWQFGAITSVLQNRLSVFPSLVIPQPFSRISYLMDVTLERNPIL